MNSQLRKFLTTAPDLYPEALERTYPRIVQSIAMAWPSPKDARALFDQLLIHDRERRQGFPPEVAREIMRLSAFYADVEAELQPEVEPTHTVWTYERL